MKVLFVGGTGIISSASSRLAVERGIDLYHLNRGESSAIRKVEGVENLIGDIRDPDSVRAAIAGHHFDAVVDWVAFDVGHIDVDIALFSGKTDQYVFISSASIYETPPSRLPITEETPTVNPVWEYSRNKIACEDRLRAEHAKNGFPYTIVRPSHTYDKTLIPMEGGNTTMKRMRAGKPVIVHGDGSSIWTLTHHADFAVGLVGLLGNERAIGEAFHITNNELLTWDMIFRAVAKELGVEPKLAHVPSDVIARYDKQIGDSLLGDKTHSAIFDNSKIKSVVPDFDCSIAFSEGVKEIASWYLSHEDEIEIDSRLDALFDRIISERG